MNWWWSSVCSWASLGLYIRPLLSCGGKNYFIGWRNRNYGWWKACVTNPNQDFCLSSSEREKGLWYKKPNPFSDIAGPVLQFWGTGWARRSGWGSGHTFGTHEVKNIHSDSAVPVGYFLLPLYMILTSYCLWMDGCRSSDHDIKSISQDLFRALTLNQKVRPLLEHHFRHLLPEWQLSPQVTYHLLLLRNCFTLIWSKLVRSKL